MAKPPDKATARWRNEFWELRFVQHGPQERNWIKRQLHRAMRRWAKHNPPNADD